MDRALKERIIGAVVLVVFVVLVVPVFLDGPPREDEVLSERVPLPGQSDQPVKVVVLERDRSQPVPSSMTLADEPADTPPPAPVAEATDRTDEPDDGATDEAEPVAVDTKPEPVVAPAPSRPEPVLRRNDSATGMWAVQLGSFSSEDNANRLAADLRKKGFAAFLSKTDGDSGTLHRVRVGPQKDRPAAEAMATRLAEAGQKGQVVPHP